MVRSLQLVLSFAALLPAVAGASQPLQTPESLARRADRVVKARVVAQVQERDPKDGAREAFVVSTLQVSETLLGDHSAQLKLAQLGGQSGAWKSAVVGDAKVERGEEAVFFLRCRDPGDPARCTLVGRADGRMPWDVRSGTVRLPRSARVKAASPEATLTLEQLRARVKAVRP